MASSSINIGGGDDQFNRYKMPPVQAKVEGRGNGIKTRIVNCADVARALHRPPGYLCKFFGCELGAQTKIDHNAAVYIVNGAFQQNVLADTLKKFIEMFVVCTNCNLPETDLKLKKNGNITQACNACGTEALCDMTHKLCTYIANNPPDGKKKKATGKLDKATRRALKAKKNNGELVDDERASKKAAKKAAKEAAAASADPLGMTSVIDFAPDDFGGAVDFSINPDDYENDTEVQWSADTSKEAEEARLRDLGAAAAILERTPVEEENNVALKLRAYIDDGKKPTKIIAKSVKLYGEDFMIRGLMLAATVDETLTTMVPSVEERVMPTLKSIGEPMDSYTQKQYLSYLDWVAAKDGRMVNILPHLLKVAFDNDVIEDKVIQEWYKEEGPQEVRDAVKVVVEWIETAEEAGSDDEEADDSEEESDGDDEE